MEAFSNCSLVCKNSSDSSVELCDTYCVNLGALKAKISISLDTNPLRAELYWKQTKANRIFVLYSNGNYISKHFFALFPIEEPSADDTAQQEIQLTHYKPKYIRTVYLDFSWQM